MRNIYRNLFLVLVLGGVCQHDAYSQSISRSVISSGGTEYRSTNGFSLDATIGETVIEDFSGPFILTQGFQQGDLLEVKFPETPDIEASLFPNPFEDELLVNIRLDADIEMRVYTAIGQLIYSVKPQTEEMSIQTTDWQTGIYFVSFSANGKRLFSEKVVKHTSK